MNKPSALLSAREVAVATASLQDLGLVKQWVLATFDRATRRAQRADLALDRWRPVISARAERIIDVSVLAANDTVNVPGHRRQQLRRLCQLAPAAIDWVSRHSAIADRHAWQDFRRHLDRRCEAIIREREHHEVNEE